MWKFVVVPVVNRDVSSLVRGGPDDSLIDRIER
jgi:hypothetical protein